MIFTTNQRSVTIRYQKEGVTFVDTQTYEATEADILRIALYVQEQLRRFPGATAQWVNDEKTAHHVRAFRRVGLKFKYAMKNRERHPDHSRRWRKWNREANRLATRLSEL